MMLDQPVLQDPDTMPTLSILKKILQRLFVDHSSWMMASLMFAFGLFSFFLGEKIAFNAGLGFDGVLFGRIARDFYQAVFVLGLDNYFIQRILPSGVVHLGLRFFHLNADIPEIVAGFAVYNSCLLLVAVVLWNRIASLLALKAPARWLGFIGLFVNFAVLKFYFYYPVLTDVTALVCTLAMLLFFLTNNVLGLVILVVLGSFVWPTLVYVGAALLIFPKYETTPRDLPRPYPLVLAAFLTTLLAGVIFYINIALQHTFPTGVVIPKLKLLSMFVLLSYAFFAIQGLANNAHFYRFGYLKRSSSLWRLAVGAALFLGIQLLIKHLSATHTDLFIISLKNLLHLGVRAPLIFILGHVMYYGPILFLFFFFWKPFCRTVHSYGLGLSIVIGFGIMFSLSSEGRHSTAFLPFFIVFLAKALNEHSLGWKKLLGLGILSLAFSKVWLLINAGLSWTQDINDTTLLSFPLQRYFMNFAPFMNLEMYLWHGLFASLSFAALYFLFKSNPSSHKTSG